jgi:hypothetical protein
MEAPQVPSVIEFFESELAGRAPVFTREQLRGILSEYKDQLQPSKSSTGDKLIEDLIKAEILRYTEIKPERKGKKKGQVFASYKPFVRYLRSGATPTEIALSLRPGSYLSHGTAVRMHALPGKRPANPS